MPDFAEPFRRSLEAARQAEANRKEIDELFDKFNDALASVTEGKAEVVRQLSIQGSLGQLVAAFNESFAKDLVLAVRNPLEPTFAGKVIAKWRQEPDGYPCSVIWGDRHASCVDAEALYHELSALFSSSPVGEAIAAAVRHQPPGHSIEQDDASD